MDAPVKLAAAQPENRPNIVFIIVDDMGWVDLAGGLQYMPANVDGLSIVPTLTGNASNQKNYEFLYWEWHRYNWSKGKDVPSGLMQAVRMGKWKAVRHQSDKPFELYDLSKDIGEKNNLADKHPDIVAKIESDSIDLEFVIEGSESLWISNVKAHAHPDAIYRQFENGLVMANPSPRPYVFDLGKLVPGQVFMRLQGSRTQDPVANDGSVVADKLELGPKEGLFLVRVE